MPGKRMDFDEMLGSLGEFGRYQKIRFFALCVPAAFLCSWAFSILIFTMRTPQHQCALPPGIQQTVNDDTIQNLKKLLIPINHELGINEQCFMLLPPSGSVNFSDIDSVMHFMRTYDNDSLVKTATCPYGWEYDKTDWDENIVTKMELVCGRSYIINTMFTIQNAGGLSGLLLFSYLQDRFGRRPTFFIALTFFVLPGLFYAFMPSWQWLSVLIFLKSFAGSACFEMPWILAVELVGPHLHTAVIVVMCVVFALACMLLSVMAYLCRTWVQLVLAATLPGILLYGYYFLLDESGRWLVATGRNRKAVKLIKKIARINKAEILPEVLIQLNNGIDMTKAQLAETQEQDWEIPASPARMLNPAVDGEAHLLGPDDLLAPKNGESAIKVKPTQSKGCCASLRTNNGIWTLFMHKNLAAKTFIICYIYAVNMMVYYGLNINIEHLGGNQYLIFAIMSAADMPGSISCFIADRIGRVCPMGVAMVLSGIALLLSSLVPFSQTALIVFCCVIAKAAISYSFDSIYLIGGELFPTVIRASGMGTTGFLASLLNLLTPFIIYTYKVHRTMPMIILGVLATIAGCLGLLLPETAGAHLNETITDCERQSVGLRSLKNNISWKFARITYRELKNEKEATSNEA